MTVFNPGGGTVVLTAGSISSDEPLNGVGDVLRIVNTSNDTAFVKSGSGAQTATASDLPVPPNSIVFMSINFADDTVAMVSPNGFAAISVNRGTAK